MPVLPNSKHEIVAQQVATGQSWEQAMIVAGYTVKGARSGQGRMSANAGIRARVVELQQSVAEKSTWDAAKVLARLGEIVDADIAEIYDDSGKLKPLKDWPKYWRRLISRIESEQKYERSRDGGAEAWDPSAALLKVHGPDRLKALELLGKHKSVDAFVSMKQQDVNISVTVTAERARDVVAARRRLERALAGKEGEK